MIPIIMPQVGENLTAATVLEWHKQEGQPVTRGEVVLTVESEKAVFEVQAEADGVVAQVLVQAGEEGAVLEPVGYIARHEDEPSAAGPAGGSPTTGAVAPGGATESSGPPGTRVPAAPGPGPDPATPLSSSASAAPVPWSAASPATGAMSAEGVPGAPRRPSSPAARRRARELGVDLARIAGTGSGGRIVVRDVAAAAAAASAAAVGDRPGPAEAPADQVVPFSRLRRHIAARTTLSSRTIPHLYLFVDIDMTAALSSLQLKPGIALTDLFIQAMARALRQFPRLNGHVEEESLVVKGAVHVGVTTAAPDGMLQPVVPDADRRNLDEIAASRHKNAAAASRGVVELGPKATVTLADLSGHDIHRHLPLINPPECAVVATGAVQKRVVSRHRVPTVRDMMSLSLGCDHRVVDAEYGARFLECLKTILEQPQAPWGGQAARPARDATPTDGETHA